jgi:alpha-beta hydrolase superfamily lysophospholipase
MTETGTRAFYLTSGVEPVYALFDAGLHAGAAPGATSSSVLLCPLFGNDDLCAYRARRAWARALAAAGHNTVRIDLPGSGDSAGGPRDPARGEAWTEALTNAACWLREETPQARVTAVGIGLGGLLAFNAAANGAPIDDLALWSVPARGRTLVRQMRVLGRMEASSARAEGPAVVPGEGALASAGFVLSDATVATLEALDLTKLELPHAARRRMLLLERDGLDVDARLLACLEASGAEVTVERGAGYGAMVAPPQLSRAPTDVFATVERWLKNQGEANVAPPLPSSRPEAAAIGAGPVMAVPQAGPFASRARTAGCIEMTVDGAPVRETPITMRHGDCELFGILAEPEHAAPLCVVLLNAGALRHIGPGRMWVELARRWAALGVPTLRIDLAGIGDAGGDLELLREDEGFYVSSFVGETLTVLDALAARGLPERFVLAGLCSGAYWSLHAAMEDDRVAGAYMINPRALFWDWVIPRMRNARNMRKIVRAGTWQKLLRGDIKMHRMRAIASGVAITLRTMPARLAGDHSKRSSYQLDLALDRLETTGAELLGIFTAEEPLLAELERDGRLARMERRQNVYIERIPGPSESHTLEPLPVQRAVHHALDRALARQLRNVSAADGEVSGNERHASAG